MSMFAMHTDDVVFVSFAQPIVVLNEDEAIAIHAAEALVLAGSNDHIKLTLRQVVLEDGKVLQLEDCEVSAVAYNILSMQLLEEASSD